jgi:hypothetical protein
MNIANYLLEYLGTLMLYATILFTNANPILVGLSHTAALYIKPDGRFSILSLIAQYSLKRIPLYECLKLAAVQIAAILSVILLYTPINNGFL